MSAPTRPEQDCAPAAATGNRQQHQAQAPASAPRRRTAALRDKLHPAHKALLASLSLALISLLLFSVSLVLEQRLSSLQSEQQIQSWKDYAKALKFPTQPEPNCSQGCEPSVNSSALRVDEEESPPPHDTGPRFHF